MTRENPTGDPFPQTYRIVKEERKQQKEGNKRLRDEQIQEHG